MRTVFFSPRPDAGQFLPAAACELRQRGCDVAHLHSPDMELDECLEGADLVIVHDRVQSGLIRKLAIHRIHHHRYRLLLRASRAMVPGEISGFDGILSSCEAVRDAYVSAGWSRSAWTWHDGIDTSLFRPLQRKLPKERAGDVVWIGNWGEQEHASHLFEYVLDPVSDLNLRLAVYGAGYPEEVLDVLHDHGVECAGALAYERIPEIFTAFRATVHLPGHAEPTTRVLEALACGIPLVSAPWDDADGLFTAGEDYLLAASGEEMRSHLRSLMEDPRLCAALSLHGLQTILSRHTCAHRVDQLLQIYEQLIAAAPVNYAVVQ